MKTPMEPPVEGKAAEKAFQQLFARHSQDDLDFLSSRGPSTEDCQDLTQETFQGLPRWSTARYSVLRHLIESFAGMRCPSAIDEDLRPFKSRHSRIETWLYMIGINTINKWCKRNAPLPDRGVSDPGASHGEGSLTELLAEERLELLRDLPQQMWRCVWLRSLGLTDREIGLALRISIQTVRVQLSQALQRLEKKLSVKDLAETDQLPPAELHKQLERRQHRVNHPSDEQALPRLGNTTTPPSQLALAVILSLLSMSISDWIPGAPSAGLVFLLCLPVLFFALYFEDRA